MSPASACLKLDGLDKWRKRNQLTNPHAAAELSSAWAPRRVAWRVMEPGGMEPGWMGGGMDGWREGESKWRTDRYPRYLQTSDCGAWTTCLSDGPSCRRRACLSTSRKLTRMSSRGVAAGAMSTQSPRTCRCTDHTHAHTRRPRSRDTRNVSVTGTSGRTWNYMLTHTNLLYHTRYGGVQCSSSDERASLSVWTVSLVLYPQSYCGLDAKRQ